jgi:hypothetical protein
MAERRVYSLIRQITVYEVAKVEARSMVDAKRAADAAAKGPTRSTKRIEGGATRWTEIKR